MATPNSLAYLTVVDGIEKNRNEQVGTLKRLYIRREDPPVGRPRLTVAEARTMMPVGPR